MATPASAACSLFDSVPGDVLARNALRERQQAAALQEFTAWRAENPTASQSAVMAKEFEITNRYLKLRPNAPTGAALLDYYGIPYRTPAELIAARERGEIAPDTFTKHLAIIKEARQGQPK